MYEKEIEFVKDYLIKTNGNNSRRKVETFRKREAHILNVLRWSKRIIEKLDDDILNKINPKAIHIAAIFHDVAYGVESFHNSHPIEGAEIFKEYAIKNNYDKELSDLVYFMIRNHQNKDMLSLDIDLNLAILMEADMLDEEGAMSICWDLMALAHDNPESYDEALDRIKKYSCHILNNNPMVTKPAKLFWLDKQEFVRNFVKELEFELFKGEQ